MHHAASHDGVYIRYLCCNDVAAASFALSVPALLLTRNECNKLKNSVDLRRAKERIPWLLFDFSEGFWIVSLCCESQIVFLCLAHDQRYYWDAWSGSEAHQWSQKRVNCASSAGTNGQSVHHEGVCCFLLQDLYFYFWSYGSWRTHQAPRIQFSQKVALCLLEDWTLPRNAWFYAKDRENLL